MNLDCFFKTIDGFFMWIIAPENFFTNLFSLMSLIISSLISLVISAIYFHVGNRNNLKSSLLYPMKKILGESVSWERYKLLEEIYREYSSKYLKKEERTAIDNLLSAYKAVCPYNDDHVRAEILFSYFTYKLKQNGIDPKPVPFRIGDEIIDMEFPDGLLDMKRELEEIIRNYYPESENNDYYQGKIIIVFNHFFEECYGGNPITYFDDFSLDKVLEKSRIRKEWDQKIKLAENTQKAFLSLSALR